MKLSRGKKKSKHLHHSKGSKLRNRKKDLDQIRAAIDGGAQEAIENPRHERCVECDRVFEGKDMRRHLASRGHKRRVKELHEDALLEKERRAGLW